MNILRVLLGRRLANDEAESKRIGPLEGVPAMGLDGLASSAYGPEAALAVLAATGAASAGHIFPVMLPIVALLAIVFFSYLQTIRAYPANAGAYVVSRENLGTQASLLAASALMIDYMLNVAVGISAGVGALISAVPSLQGHTLQLCLAVLAVVTLVNLRGTAEAGRLFAVPTYLFIASFGGILLIGLYKAVISGGAPAPVVAPPPLRVATEGLGWWLLLRAFASGCTAMTGIEAVSDGMNAFREPRVPNGQRTLAAIVVILAFLLLSVAWLAQAFHIGAMDQSREGYRSVLSQLASAVVGTGPWYAVAMASLLAVLALSANTSFVDFPRLCRFVARDGFLPTPFAVAGQRLVFTVGILFLTGGAAILLVAFGGITEHLIPLFAVGAFLTFTLSQTGMVRHWRRELRKETDAARRHRIHLKMALNATGAVATGLALAVIVVAKFAEGAWITVLVVPATILLLRSIRAYYVRVARVQHDPTPLDLGKLTTPILLVTIEDWNEVTDRALSLALSLSPHVVGVHLANLSGPDEDYNVRLQARWERNVAEPARRAGFKAPELVILQARFRSIHEPVLALARDLEVRFPDKSIAVLVPELVKQKWHQRLLHTHRARKLRTRLLRHGGSRLTVVNVPWYLEDPKLPQVVAA